MDVWRCINYHIQVFMCFLDLCTASRIYAIYPMDTLSHVMVGGGLSAPTDKVVLLRLVGVNLSSENGIYFTTSNWSCSLVKSTDTYYPAQPTHNRTSAVIKMKFEPLPKPEDFWYMCLIRLKSKGKKTLYDVAHQGTEEWVRVKAFDGKASKYFFPIWLQITLCGILLIFSGLFSGLNLGLMSLDQTELKIIEKVGSESEQRHARRIAPLRKRGNFLLCTLLLGNVLVNNTFTILFENMTNGAIAVTCATVGIVIFGEIVPQAVCSRHGLAIGAQTYWVTVFFMLVTFPASYPISLILDFFLGEEMGQAFSKEKLQELILLTADKRVLHDNEANIITGALQLTNKTVEDVMTKIDDVYMLEINTVLDFETLTEIMHQGYTRIPVYEGDKTNIVNLLNTKELALIDPDDKTHLSTVCKFYDHRPLFVDYDVRLDAMLQAFLQAGSSHMAIVQKLHKPHDKDPYFENLGVITLEDVIEEILQSEIVDETDLKTDNRQRDERPEKQQEYELLMQDERKSTLPNQLAFAAFQFLTTTVEPFSDAHLARNVLKTLMKKDIVVTLSPTEKVSKKNYIYEKGVPSDKFVLILQGTVEVEVGGESMVFETGPFSYFGVDCINKSRKASAVSDAKSKDYIPDFSVRAVTDVQYLCITKQMYLAAVRTSKLIRQGGNIKVTDAFEQEYEKLKVNANHSSHTSMPESEFLTISSDGIKNGKSAKKQSTSSLDRQKFFQHRHESFKEVDYLGYSGCNGRLRSYEMIGKAIEPAMQIEPSLPAGSNGHGSVTDSLFTDRQMKACSQDTFTPNNFHSLQFLIEKSSKDEVRLTLDLAPIEPSFPSKTVTVQEVMESAAAGDILNMQPIHQPQTDDHLEGETLNYSAMSAEDQDVSTLTSQLSSTSQL